MDNEKLPDGLGGPENNTEGPANNIEGRTKDTQEPAEEDNGNGGVEAMQNMLTPKPDSESRQVGMAPLAGAHTFVIHHATFINSETVNFSMPAQCE